MEIQIWVGNLAAYNRGDLIGKWFDLSEYSGSDEIIKEVMALPGAEPGDEEWFIADYDAPFQIDEYDDIDKLIEITDTLSSLDETYDIPRVLYMVNDVGYSWTDALNDYEDVDFYPDMNLKDLAYQFLEEGLFSPEQLMFYADIDQIAYDLGIDGYYYDEEIGEVRDNEEQRTGYTSMKELAEAYVDEGLFDEQIKNGNYVDIEFMAKELGYDYDEQDDGVFRAP